ncbi:aldehyde dehydrogenase family protein [Tomitella gaofuii]|uniref:aldehyde dehydrogenase family protein n=1 Tax=Tomitella gaofuii TaxID=2760083 RepID=UPI0015FD696F|nr:aldehyde dehydrogenase family protein [Tomitella gaofuii]
MTTVAESGSAAAAIAALDDVLARQRAARRAEGMPSAAVRRARIQAVIDLLVDEYDAIVTAVDEDFGGRHRGYSIMNDVLGSLGSLKSSRDRLEEWMAPEHRKAYAPYDQYGATAEIRYTPKGTVGILGTWNAPVFTLLSPLASALAAGNRAVLKPSEVVPRTAETLARLFTERIDPLDVAVVTGGPAVAEQFTTRPFGHLVFTGSTSVGRAVMRSAAENLVPVTLELGGKSPTLVSRSADLAAAAGKVAGAKSSNGGQLCVSPDLVYVPRESVDAFVTALTGAYSQLVPTVQGNPGAISIVDDRHARRVAGLVDDARTRGARIETVPDEQPDGRRTPLHVVVDPPEDTAVMREELFGPAVVVLGYDTVDDVLGALGERPAPLALYWLGTDDDELQTVLDGTTSGGVTVNDLMLHPGLEDAPFGGVGDSGMGHYHGREGFVEFSHARTVFHAPAGAGQPPAALYPEGFEQMMASMITR